MQSYSDKQKRNRNRLWQDPRFFGWQLKYPEAFCVPPSETLGNHRWCQTIVQSAKDKESGAGEDLAMIFCVRGASAWTIHWSPKAIKCFAWRVNLGAARQKQAIEYNKKAEVYSITTDGVSQKNGQSYLVITEHIIQGNEIVVIPLGCLALYEVF